MTTAFLIPFLSIPHSKLEFHPYTYLNFCIPSSFPQTPCTSMSNFSVNPSNKSPASILPQSPLQIPPCSPILPIPFNPVATTVVPTYPPLSLQTALNVLATQSNLNDTIQAIAYGLVSTVHNHEIAYTLQSKGLQDTNTAL